jgi:hypothetical protein
LEQWKSKHAELSRHVSAKTDEIGKLKEQILRLELRLQDVTNAPPVPSDGQEATDFLNDEYPPLQSWEDFMSDWDTNDTMFLSQHDDGIGFPWTAS